MRKSLYTDWSACNQVSQIPSAHIYRLEYLNVDLDCVANLVYANQVM